MKSLIKLLTLFFLFACSSFTPSLQAAEEPIYFEIRWGWSTKANLQKEQGAKARTDGRPSEAADYSDQIAVLEAIETSFSSVKGCEIAEDNKVRRVVLLVTINAMKAEAGETEATAAVTFTGVGVSAAGSDMVLMLPGRPSELFLLTPTTQWPISMHATRGTDRGHITLAAVMREAFAEWKTQNYDDFHKLFSTPEGQKVLNARLERVGKEMKERAEREKAATPKSK